MAKLTVLVTRSIPSVGIDLLKKYFLVEVYKGRGPIPRRVLLSKVKRCDALLSLLTEKIDKEILDAGVRLKVVANYAVGVDNIDVEYARSKGIVVTNTPGVLEEAVAEHTFALLFSLGRRILEADAFVRAHKYKYWDPMLLLGTQFSGKTLGLMGLGHIGEAVAIRAHGLKMKIVYHDVVRHRDLEMKVGARYVKSEELLRSSDFVSLHVPLLSSTRHLISTRELSMMKRTALLINTARGPVIDEEALVLAIKAKKIAGAALDVFEFEPRVSRQLLSLQNVILTPHIASGTLEAREMMADIAARNIIQVLKGKRPISLV